MSKRPSKTDRRPSDTESDDDPFLSRWARRKRAARSGGDPDAREPGTPDTGKSLASAAPQAGDAPLEAQDQAPVELTDDDMPPVDSIDEDTDMSGFFSPKVSQAIKKAALRKFFHSPAFNIVDGLDDYDDDFKTFAALGDIVTSDMRGQMERKADESMDGRGRAKQDARAERAKEELAKNDASVEPTATPEETAERVQNEKAPQDERMDERATSPDDDVDSGTPAEANAGLPGITRDPATHAAAGPGKLRPRRDDDRET